MGQRGWSRQWGWPRLCWAVLGQSSLGTGTSQSQGQGQGSSGPGVRDAPSWGSETSPAWGQECSIPGVRDALVLWSGTLQPWGQGCSGPGVKETPSLGSGTLHPWVRDALCDREPNSGHHACAGGAGHQPAPLLLALTPRPSPCFTWEQPQAPRDTSCHPTQGILHPPSPTGTEGRATTEQTKPK